MPIDTHRCIITIYYDLLKFITYSIMPLPAVKPGKLKLKLNNVNKILNEAPVRKK